MKSNAPFKLGYFTVNPREYIIEDGCDRKNSLQPRFIEVLTYLASQYPRLVSRGELIENVWSGNHYVGEKALTNAIWNLRQELKHNDKQFIETVRKIGYRLSVKPEYFSDESTSTGDNPSSEKTKSLTVLKPLLLWSISACLFSFSLIQFFGDKDKAQTKINNITTDPGRELYPSISPNGRYMIFTERLISQASNLYLKDLSQPDLLPRQITFSDDIETRAVWSNDSEQVFFVRKSWDLSNCRIVRITLTTAEEQVVGSCPDNDPPSISISRDGNTLAYTGISYGYLNSGIYFLDLTVSDAVPQRFSCGNECTYRDRDFAFSPDDRYLAVSRREGPSAEDVFLIELATRKTRQLTFSEGDIKGLAWHPDGKRIVYGSENSGTRDGYVISLGDGNISRLNVPGFSYPAFHPNRNELFFHCWHVLSHISYLSISDTMGTAPFPLVQSEFSHKNPDYSQKSDRLAFVSNESGYNEIWVSAVDGGERKRLTNLTTNLSSPQWSHDGKSIAFLGPKESKTGNDIYILDVLTQRIRRLSSPFNRHYRPSWLRNDKAILASASKDNLLRLYQFPLDNNEPELILTESVALSFQDVDNTIWYTKTNEYGLWQYNPSQPQSKSQRVLSPEHFGARYNWRITEGGIYYQFDYADHNRINHYDLTSKKTRSLVRLPIRTIDRYGSITYIPKLKQLVFGGTQYPQVDIKQLQHPLLN